MGQLDSNVQRPTSFVAGLIISVSTAKVRDARWCAMRRVVAPQVAFDMQTLKPAFSLDSL
jgi:hypothetical protein